ncbi:MAG: hypothetical protein Kow0092_33720 [Deferrisomatales bacterium]
MAFGWFSRKKPAGGKTLQKARTLAAQARWAEALSYYEEALGAGADPEEARAGGRTCREHLVAWNVEEAQGYRRAGEPEKAREHAELALELAGEEADLAARARALLDTLGREATPAAGGEPTPPERLFTPSCGAGAACSPGAPCPAQAPAEEPPDPAALFELYLDSLSDAERRALEPLDDGFREGFVLLQQGEAAAARPLLEAAAARHPQQPGAHYALGLLEAVEGHPERAEGCFARALEADPSFGPAVHHRAEVLREAGGISRATRLLEEWLGGAPDDGEGWVALATCRAQLEAPQAALEAAERAGALLPEQDPRPQLLRAQVLAGSDRKDEAVQALQAVVARRPDLVAALVPLGQLLLEKGGTAAERAAEIFKHCYRLEPERGWWHLLRVAEAYAARGWLPEARDMLQSAREILPEGAEARAQWETLRDRLSA